MEIRWEIDGEFSGLEYSFVDYEIKGYSVQDHVKVAAVIKLAVETVQDRHSATKMSSFSHIMQVDFPCKN